MNTQTLQELGLTKEDVLERLVERLLSQYSDDEEGYVSDFEKRIETSVKEHVDKVLSETMEKHVLPRVAEMVDNLCLEETNKWGEKKGSKITFVEYLVQRADAYIREEVNYKGLAKGEDSYSWSKHSTRIAHMIHQHLQFNISKAMELALGEVNSSVRKGLKEAVEVALSNIKVSVATDVRS